MSHDFAQAERQHTEDMANLLSRFDETTKTHEAVEKSRAGLAAFEKEVHPLTEEHKLKMTALKLSNNILECLADRDTRAPAIPADMTDPKTGKFTPEGIKYAAYNQETGATCFAKCYQDLVKIRQQFKHYGLVSHELELMDVGMNRESKTRLIGQDVAAVALQLH